MELFTTGFETAFKLVNLLYCFVGVFLGTLVGVLPGIGGLAAVSLLLPVSFHLEPTTALVMLAGVYYGAEYGGSTASILLNLPGTASNAVTCLDGYPMTRQGRAGAALFITAVSSFIGGSIGIMLLIFLTPAIVALALSFGPAEYFAAMLFGLIAAGTIGQGAPIKSVAMVLLGVLLGTIGMDINTGQERYTLGFMELFDGLSVVILAMGLFGVAEVIASVNSQTHIAFAGRVTLRSLVPTGDDIRRSVMPIVRGTGVGCLFGALPGTGPTISSFLSYALEKRIARRPSRFGQGAVEGIAAPEASNNAAVQTSFIPTLSLGIPGSATMAVMLGAMMIHGIAPGPRLMIDHPDLFWGLVASFWIGNVLLLILNLPLIGLWVRLLQIPYKFLHPTIICLICIGAYSIGSSVFDVWLVLLFGLVGYGMRLLAFEPAPLLIGFILGPMIEENLRRAMLLAGGDPTALFLRPISGVLLGLAGCLVLWLLWSVLQRERGKALALASRQIPQGDS